MAHALAGWPAAQVDARDNIYNVYMGPDGEPQRVAVGNLADLGKMKVSELGGLSPDDLRKAAAQRGLPDRSRDTIVAFPDPDAGSVMLPPNTPFTRGKVRIVCHAESVAVGVWVGLQGI